MGHFGSASEQRTATEERTVFESFKNHFSARSEHTQLTVAESIRRLHPDKHVTPVYQSRTGLLRYAEAGFAKAHLIRDNEQVVVIRDYAPPRSRLEQGDGTLTEGVSFGLFDYTWKTQKFQLYSVSWTAKNGVREMYFYILTPKQDVDDQGQSPLADALIKAAGKWNAALHEEIYVFDNGCWQKNHQLWSAVQSATWDDVILDPAMKDTLINDVEDFFDSRTVYEEYGVPWKRGIIFHGTPGCGKTISIKALMNSLQRKDVASLYVKSFDACQGMQHSIRAIFNQARIMAPCMLVFEDLDSLVVDSVRSYFLNEVDGLEDNNGILMIGSTNHLEKLDPAISKRPSRFDRKYHYNLPGLRERTLYCKYWQAKLQKSGKIDFTDDICEVVAKLTEGWSFAYLKELFVQTVLAIVGGRADSEAEDDSEVAVTNAAEQAKVVDGSGSVLKGDGKVESSLASDETSEATATSTGQATIVMPEVEISDELHSKPLMRILLKQTRALWKEMDNTTDDIHSRKKVASS